MDHKEFDKHIRSLLQETEKPTSPDTDWDSFSSLLMQEEEFKDIDFDAQIAQKLRQKRVPFNSLHWVIIKNRLEKEAQLRKNVFITKILEGVLAILLTFTYFNIYQGQDHSPAEQKSRNVALLQVIESPELAVLDLMEASPAFAKASLPHAAKNAPSSTQPRIATLPIISNNLLANWKLPVLVAGRRISQPQALNAPRGDQAIEVHMVPNCFANTNNTEEKSELRDAMHIPLLASISKIPYNMDHAYPMFYVKPKTLSKSYQFLQVNTIHDFTIVRSPRDEDFNINAYNAYSYDFGVGVQYGVKYADLEVSTGIGVQRIAYQPAKVSEITGSFAANGYTKQTLKDIKFDIIQVPLDFRYDIVNNTKFNYRLWAGVGVGINGVLFSEYDVRSQQLTPLAPNEPDRFIGRNPEIDSKLLQKNFHEGLAESGSVFDNFYMSANASIGLDIQFNEKFVTMFSLGYNKSLASDGIGPNEDIIDAVRMAVGFKYRI